MALQRFRIEIPEQTEGRGIGRTEYAMLEAAREVSAEEVLAVIHGLGLGVQGSDSGVSVYKEESSLPPTLQEYVAGLLGTEIEYGSDEHLKPWELKKESEKERRERHREAARTRALLKRKTAQIKRLTK